MDLEIIILSEVSQTERQISYDIAYLWHLKKMVQMNKIVTNVENLWLRGGKRRDKMRDWDCTTIYKIDTHKDLLYIAQGTLLSTL